MFTDLKPYPEYAESGVTWLGPFPVHWNVRRAKYLFRDIDVRSKTGHQQQLSVSHLTGVSPRSTKTVTMFKAVSYVGHKTCLAGDLVVNTMWAWMGALGIAREAGIVSPAYNVYRPLRTCGVNVEFVAVLFRTPAYIAYFRSHSTGLRPSRLRFYPDELLATPALLPPWDEQAAIVKYLGHANLRIDRAIAAKRKLIALLEAQKQAVMNQAVTRGLDPNVPLKDPGIPSLGQIPAPWQVARIKDAFRCLNALRVPLSSEQRGAMVSRQFDYYGASGVIDKVDNYLFDEPLILLAEDGANLVSRNLPLAILARGRYWVNNHAHILRPKSGIVEYLAHRLELVDYRPWISGAAQPKLTRDRFMSIPIAVPPLEEQNSIIAFLKSEAAPSDFVISRANREIELLREFRTRLTADVVTGQLDIRAAASRLPELDPADLVSDAGPDEDDLDADLAASFEEVDA